MKKLYTLFFSSLCLLGFSQHPDLLNTNWKITKIVSETRPDQFPPSMPYQQQTNFPSGSSNLSLSFFNTVSAEIAYSGQDMFTISNKACTVADYNGDNGQVNQFFGYLCSFFNNQGNYFYFIQNNGNQKTLVISTPIFEEIHFVSEILAVKDNELTKSVVSPNPAKDFITIDNIKIDSKITITDASGKLVKTIFNKSSKETVDIKNLMPGIYYLKVDGQPAQKIIKK